MLTKKDLVKGGKMDRKMKKKGQASMEFLMTYGWAILAAVVAIGVLAYYGVFSPGNTLPSVCVVNAPLGCDEYQISATSGALGVPGARVVILNGAGDSITIQNVAVAATGTATCTDYTVDEVVNDGDQWDNILDCAGLAEGDKFNADITVTYLRNGKSISETSTGDIRGEVVA